MSFEFLQLHVVYCQFLDQLTSENNVFDEFHHFHFSSRIGTRGTYYLEVDSAMVFMRFMCRRSLELSAMFVCHP